MKEIIEVLFEELHDNELYKAVLLVFNCVSGVNRIELQGSKYIVSDLGVIINDFDMIIKEIKHGYPLYISCKQIALDEMNLLNAAIRIFAYEKNKYDLEISFDLFLSKIETQERIIQLHKKLNILAKLLNAKNILCGYEPATDESTRFFTNNKFGPLSM